MHMNEFVMHMYQLFCGCRFLRANIFRWAAVLDVVV